jgi:uncharacterized protein YqgC (DUF456 family)
MDLSDSGSTVTVISGLAIVAGVLGVLIPILPGLLLCWAGVLLWALLGHAGAGGWIAFTIATLIAIAGTVIKYLWPGKRLKNTGVPTSSLVLGGVLGAIGFFVVPVVGLILGFILGVWLAERSRLGPGRAWPSTRQALAAVGLSMLIEFLAAVAIGVVWLIALAAT